MKKYFTIVIFIFLLNCSFNEAQKGISNTNILQNEINDSDEYSFDGYVNLLLNKNISKEYPDINNFPD